MHQWERELTVDHVDKPFLLTKQLLGCLTFWMINCKNLKPCTLFFFSWSCLICNLAWWMYFFLSVSSNIRGRHNATSPLYPTESISVSFLYTLGYGNNSLLLSYRESWVDLKPRNMKVAYLFRTLYPNHISQYRTPIQPESFKYSSTSRPYSREETGLSRFCSSFKSFFLHLFVRITDATTIFISFLTNFYVKFAASFRNLTWLFVKEPFELPFSFLLCFLRTNIILQVCKDILRAAKIKD